MYIVSADDAKTILFNSDFYEYARAQGIRDPLEVSQKLFKKKCRNNADGSIEWDKFKADPEESTHAERGAWIRMRDKYIAQMFL